MNACRTLPGNWPEMRQLAVILLLACAALGPWSSLARAADPLVEFASEGQRTRYDRLLEEYRCLKCQNQNLADSNAALADDLRREIHVRILDGSSDEVIDDYLVSRYGDFVRYKPRFSGITLALWIAPFVLLAIGLGTAVLLSRRAASPVAPASAQENEAIEEARRLLRRS